MLVYLGVEFSVGKILCMLVDINDRVRYLVRKEHRNEQRYHHHQKRHEQKLPLEYRHRRADRLYVAANKDECLRVAFGADVGAHRHDGVVLALVPELLVINAGVRVQRRLLVLLL